MTEDQIQAVIKAAKCGTIVAHVEAMLNAEREACAMVAENASPRRTECGKKIAAAIRARGEKV